VSSNSLFFTYNQGTTPPSSQQFTVGGGGGTLRVWREPDAVVCEVRDRGFIRDPLVGRMAPPIEQYGGRGLWIVNQLCDLVQIRSAPSGTVVRVHMHAARPATVAAPS